MKKIKFKKIISSALTCIIGFSIITGCSSLKKENVTEVSDINNAPFEITVMNVGKADCILIEIEDKSIMIDTGLNKSGKDIINTLDEKNIDTLDYLILTHMDKDHIGGADTVIENININNLIAADYVKDSKQYKQYVEAMEENNLQSILLHENMSFEINNAVINIYPSEKKSYEKSNDYSIMVDITYGNYNFLFAGDAEEERLSEFLKNNNKQYTFVKMPHHGRGNNLSAQLIKQTNPNYAVITCSEDEMAEDELLSLLDKNNTKTFLTKDGEVVFKTDGNQICYKVK